MPKKFKSNSWFLGFFLILALITTLSNLLLKEYFVRIQTLLNEQKVLSYQTSQEAEETAFWQKIVAQFPTYKPAREKLQK
jgi:hypothetical protein